MEFPGLPGRLAQVRERIGFHQARGGWTHPVRIIAVTKSHGVEAVRAALAAGLDDIGENRVQEALAKQAELAGLPVRWHLIGALQRNKVRPVVGRFALIHSVDRVELVQELDRRIAGADPPARQPVLVEVNCSGEAAKSGVEPAGLDRLLEAVSDSPRLELRGLMTLAALSEEEQVQRTAFSRLRGLRDRMRDAGYSLPELSMGMSADYPVAVEEGATMVRLGTLLFGERPR
ncbi:MAG TPA: YggS family pyridoxal phosphate-dependent enzyme [Gemmatimonadales bacterium]|nr:YggS family pyridoxal phosphate-dependent enzyme [Gemmatimonadales bacterium]